MAGKAALQQIVEGNAQLRQDGPGPCRVLVMSGLPLSGKSHIVDLILGSAPGRFLLVRSDEVRPYVANSLGRQRPSYDAIEHVTTFMAASEVVRLGLTLNWPVIADATNLREEFRRWAYGPADAFKAPVLVAFMQVTDETALARLSERDRDGSAATFAVYRKLSYEAEPVDRCTKPYVVIDSDGDMRPHAKALAEWLSGSADAVPGQKNPAGNKAGQRPKEETGHLDFYTGERVD